MVDVVLSPEVNVFLAQVPQPERALTRRGLGKLSDPRRFLTMRPLLGAGPEWRVTTVGPFRAICRLLIEDEAVAQGARHPAVMVATLDRNDDLKAEGERLVEDAERGR